MWPGSLQTPDRAADRRVFGAALAHISERAGRAGAGRAAMEFAVMFLALDRFKLI